MQVEITFIEECYPLVNVEINSIIGEWLKSKNKFDDIEKYNLKPFNVVTQALERTFIDKIFAICDYHISRKITGHSRHLYDLFKIKDKIEFDNKFFELLKNVKIDRSKNDRSYSAQNSINFIVILKDLINEKTFYEDFINYTQPVLFEDIKYEMLINNLNDIIGIFEKNKELFE